VEEHFRPLVEYAARKLSATGETKGVVIVAPTAGQMVKLLEEKRVDFYMESPYPTYLINRLGAAKLLLRDWKGGMAEYRGLIFTSKESGVAQLNDLRGKIQVDVRLSFAQALPTQKGIFRRGKGKPRE
jgi:ABC-type phosphate/phosphonate transport system substrate-binding protein